MPAVPHSPFADTGIEAGVEYRYRIAAVPGAEYPAWNWSDEAGAAATDAAAKPLTLRVDATKHVDLLQRVWQMVGSERLTQLRFGDDGNGNDIGAEFAEALQIAKDDLRADRVRAHAILHDDNKVVTRADDGSLAFDFTVVDALYDQILAIGIRPVVELSFMPAAIATRSGRDGVRLPRHHLPAGRLGRVARRSCARSRPTSSSATASTRCAPGDSRCGTSRTSRCSGPARRTSTCGSTTRPRPR